jgi:cytochrome P450
MHVDFADPALLEDPFPTYESIRQSGRCVWNENSHVWMVTGHGDAMDIFRQADAFSSSPTDDGGPWFRDVPLMMSSDGSTHQRLRDPVRQAFSFRRSASREAAMDAAISNLLESSQFSARVESGESVDVAAELSGPLPIVITADLLDVPARDRDLFYEWCNDLVMYTGVVQGTHDPLEQSAWLARANKASDSFWTYMEQRLQRQSGGDGTSLVDLLGSAIDAKSMTVEEAIAATMLLLLAGTDSTMKLLSNLVSLIAGRDEVISAFATKGRTSDAGLEELIRVGGPVQLDARKALSASTVGFQNIAEGDEIWILNAAANRDPSVFAHPEAIDLTRAPNPHLGFGYGAHMCLGFSTAKVLASTFVRNIAPLLPGVGVESTTHGRGKFVRGPVSLIVKRT